MSYYDRETREKIVGSLLTFGTSRDRANEIVDLACSAAEKAAQALVDSSMLASSEGAGMYVIEIGAQLIAARCTAIFEHVSAMASAAALPRSAVQLGGGQ